MKTQQQQCTTTTITVRLCLLVALLALAGTANAFTTPSTTTTTKFHRVSTHRFSEPSDDAPAPVASAGDAAATASSDAAAGQASYGTTEELPESYVRCGKCQTSFALTEEDLGVGGKGRRLECSVCNHSWFQSIDRIMTMQDGFEMIKRPEYEIERVHLNLRENKAPNFMGEQKLYVGNIAFECGEQDIYEVFNEVGSVGDVSLVRDDEGRVRGFGFVTMRTVAEGEKAIAELDGAEVKGRNIAVRPSNN